MNRLPVMLASVVIAALAVATVACSTAEAPETAVPTEPASTAAASATAAVVGGAASVAIEIADPEERDRIAAAVGASGELVVVPARGRAASRSISDTPIAGAAVIVLARWAAITDQRRDVLELTRAEVIAALRGEITDWSDLGGSARPLVPYVPAGEADAIADALGIPRAELAATLVPDAEIVARVAGEPGALALVQPEALRLGVLALVVDGHDPYRDPAADSPLRDARWIAAPAGQAATLAALAGFKAAPTFDPAGMLATGELIPARCTHAALLATGSLDSMFDATGDLIRAADIAVTPLEVSLTDRSEPTPCVETFNLQGPAEAANAFARVGIDVVVTAGNHAMDCWDGCSPRDALLDTIENLRNAGLETVGAGENLAAARTPATFTVETLNGPVTFAFVAYDSIAAAFYGAGPDQAGTAPLETAYVWEDVSAAVPLADHVVMGAGWGIEYTSDPTAFQVENAHAAIEAGATVVLGNHPHWVQAVEHLAAGDLTPEARDALIAYSFGNFVFDQDWSTETTQGMAMELGFTAERLIGYRIRPVIIRGNPDLYRGLYRPEFVDPATEGAPILQRIWDAQDRLALR